MEFQALMKNVSFTNFIQFQVYNIIIFHFTVCNLLLTLIKVVVNGAVVGTAIWHLNLESDFVLGATMSKKLILSQNWFQRILTILFIKIKNYFCQYFIRLCSYEEIGSIEVELTPVNISFPSDYEEVHTISTKFLIELS